MCWAWFDVYPGSVQARCTGPLWTGELGPEEKALGLELHHPVEEAEFVLDGSDMLSGGGRVYRDAGKCTDSSFLEPYCGMLVDMTKSAGLPCREDLRAFAGTAEGEALLGKQMAAAGQRMLPEGPETLLKTCCRTACARSSDWENGCQDHELCATDEPPEGLACAACEAEGFGPDGCGCGVCGSFGACNLECKASEGRPACIRDDSADRAKRSSSVAGDPDSADAASEDAAPEDREDQGAIRVPEGTSLAARLLLALFF